MEFWPPDDEHMYSKHHTYMSDDTRGCVMQFWPPDDEHMYSKHHTYMSDDTRGCVMQFWPPDDEAHVLETCRDMK